MAVSPVNNSGGGTDYGTGNSAGDLTNSFMQLLVAQMQNQDPTNPMDNNQLTAQLAQFNTAAGVEKLNTSVASMYGLVNQLGSMSAASWVGRHVLIEGDPKVTTGSGIGLQQDGAETADEFSFLLGSDADTVTVTLTDAEGNAYTAELKNVKAGVQNYSLDDLQNFQPEPGPAPDTEYTVTFDAKNAEGEKPEVSGLMQVLVEGVTMTANGAVLHLKDHDPIGMSDVVVIQK
ncbi:flagellar hook assembly protein FlgD [Scandinavium goeteborgense]|uniref:Basal-body rod modification protein FlgD n=1 Tax=Scandinavium goeteborgense TaxID=1851514 RepID=A0A4V3BPM8_SCAGO|nr:flagellar hook capping FlgD N-terminal domain-containing protein [Scandinavium goeteborgense]TDN59447.1 flagellar basal-body rod modification protein FlgD [Scandinavium goeteborgense]